MPSILERSPSIRQNSQSSREAFPLFPGACLAHVPSVAMEHREPMMPSHRYSPVGEYTCGCPHDIIPPTRTPLGESTGNAQAYGLGDLALCHQSQLSLSPPLQPIPTPPLFSTQAADAAYGTSLRSRRSFPRDVSLRDPSMAPSRASRNPIHAWKYFSDYRAKVAQKEREGEEPKWPMYLEDAFLDGKLDPRPMRSLTGLARADRCSSHDVGAQHGPAEIQLQRHVVRTQHAH